MNSFASGLFLLTMLCFSPVFATVKESNIYAVMDEIFDGYKPYARPVKSSATVTIVHVSFNLMSINSVDEKPQTMSQSLYLRLHWIDEHLAWNPSEHGGLDSLIVPQDKIWLPDIIISPFAGKMQRLGYNELPVVVESSGQITWQPSGVFTTRCAMDITFYPFDKQFCQLRLELWASSTRDAILTLSELRPVVRDNLVENSEWELMDVIPEQKNETLSDEMVNSIVMLSYTLRRRPMFVTLTVVLPTVLLALLSTLVFALPAESGEKMSMCVTVFLTFVLSLSIMLNVLPNSSLQLSVHVTYLAALSACSALFVLLSLLVLRLYHLHGTAPPVGPGWAMLLACVRRYKRWNPLSDALKTLRRATGRYPDRKDPLPEKNMDLHQLHLQTVMACVQGKVGSLPRTAAYAAAIDGNELPAFSSPLSSGGSVVSASDADWSVACSELKMGGMQDYLAGGVDDDDVVLRDCQTLSAEFSDKDSAPSGVRFIPDDLRNPVTLSAFGDDDEEAYLNDSQREVSQQTDDKTGTVVEKIHKMGETKDIGSGGTLKSVRQTKVIENPGQTQATQKKDQTQTIQKKDQTQAIQQKDQTQAIQKKDQTQAAQQSDQMQTVQKMNEVQAVQKSDKIQAVQQTSQVQAVRKIGQIQTVQKIDQMQAARTTGQAQRVRKIGQTQAVQKTGQIQTVEKTRQMQAVQKTGQIQTVEKTGQIQAVEKTGMEYVQPVCGTDAAQKAEKHVTRNVKRESAEDAIGWGDVADSLDYVMFRFFLCFVVLATITSTALLVIQYQDVSHDW